MELPSSYLDLKKQVFEKGVVASKGRTYYLKQQRLTEGEAEAIADGWRTSATHVAVLAGEPFDINEVYEKVIRRHGKLANLCNKQNCADRLVTHIDAKAENLQVVIAQNNRLVDSVKEETVREADEAANLAMNYALLSRAAASCMLKAALQTADSLDTGKEHKAVLALLKEHPYNNAAFWEDENLSRKDLPDRLVAEHGAKLASYIHQVEEGWKSKELFGSGKDDGTVRTFGEDQNEEQNEEAGEVPKVVTPAEVATAIAFLMARSPVEQKKAIVDHNDMFPGSPYMAGIIIELLKQVTAAHQLKRIKRGEKVVYMGDPWRFAIVEDIVFHDGEKYYQITDSNGHVMEKKAAKVAKIMSGEDSSSLVSSAGRGNLS